MEKILKTYVISTIKILGFYQEIPFYKLKSLYYLIVLFLPFTPTFLYAESQNGKTLLTMVVFFIFYIFTTVAIGINMSNLGKRWKTSEYSKITISYAIINFIIIQIIYSVLTLLSFILVNIFIEKLL
ncbi:hypothetical protein [Flavobacterium sp. 102]|uniref:hypothetical protein n=1 Tax=Flavobacterium sp. 102 TaxID=2135623 RepID=UPI000EAD80D3|nr:hypothetical protein [Flavobacterium sp. 102]RKS02851.1 hypothetical protein C8C84_2581 [Flavobacterium sp. 102]